MNHLRWRFAWKGNLMVELFLLRRVVKLLHLRSLNLQTLAKIRIQMYHLVAPACKFFWKKESDITYTIELDDCIDSQSRGSVLEIELDDDLKPQVIEDRENGPRVVKDPGSVQVAKHTEVRSVQDNPDGKSKPIVGDEPCSVEQYDPLLNLSPDVSLGEVSLTGKRYAVPFNIPNQAEKVKTEADVASELGRFMVGRRDEVNSIIEPKGPNNAIPKLADSVVVKDDEGVA